MRITYDEPKRAVNLRSPGLDFADFETAKRFPTYASRVTDFPRFGLIGWF